MHQFVNDLITNSIWLLGSLAVVAIVGTSILFVGKFSKALFGQEIEIDQIFFLAGAFVGMLFLPSGDHATAESRVMLVLALASGAFFGGLVGLGTQVWLSKRTTETNTNPKLQNKSQNVASLSLQTLGRVLLVAIIFVAGAVVATLRFGDLPFFGPIVEFILQTLKGH